MLWRITFGISVAGNVCWAYEKLNRHNRVCADIHTIRRNISEDAHVKPITAYKSDVKGLLYVVEEEKQNEVQKYVRLTVGSLSNCRTTMTFKTGIERNTGLSSSDKNVGGGCSKIY